MLMNNSVKLSHCAALIVAVVNGLFIAVSGAQDSDPGPADAENPKSKTGELLTKIYKVPPSFVYTYEGGLADPFASDGKVHPKSKRKIRTPER